MKEREKPRVVVIGLDGATWNLIKPWVDEGELPTFRKLMHVGTWGKLKSVVPISTAPSWKCYSTGKNPGKLGAYYWYSFDREQKKIKMANSTSFKGKEIWDYLSEAGYKCGVINMPVTFPPKKVNGFMISGFNALDQLDYTYPKELKQELISKYNYKVNPDHALRLNLLLGREKAVAERDEGLSEIREIIKSRFTVAKDLWRRENLDFLHLTIFYIDGVQHYMWGPMAEKDPSYGHVLSDFWKMIDAELDDLLEEIGEDTHVLIMSDHGFVKLRAMFKFNMWLHQRGHLLLKARQRFSLAAVLYRLGINTQRAYRISRSRIGDIIVRFVPHSLITKMWFLLRTSKDEANITDILNMADWERTKAIAIDEMVFINIARDIKEYEDFREKLIQEVKEIEDPKTGEKITSEVRKGEEEYTGKYARTGPDVVVTLRDGYYASLSISRNNSSLFTYHLEDGYSGFHAMDGVFLASGPGIKEGKEIEGAKIYDLAPTILDLFGCPVPGDMDGRVLKEVFDEAS